MLSGFELYPRWVLLGKELLVQPKRVALVGVNSCCFDTRTPDTREHFSLLRPNLCRRIFFLHSQFQEDGTDKEDKVLGWE